MSRRHRISEFSDTASETGQTGISVNDLTGGGRGNTATKSYINKAFSFLDAEEYNPYDQFVAISDPEQPNVKPTKSKQDAQTQVNTRPKYNRIMTDSAKERIGHLSKEAYGIRKNPNVINITLDNDENSKKTNLRLSSGQTLNAAGFVNKGFQRDSTASPTSSVNDLNTSYEYLPAPSFVHSAGSIPENGLYDPRVTNKSVISVHSESEKGNHQFPPVPAGGSRPSQNKLDKEPSTNSCISNSRLKILVILIICLLLIIVAVIVAVYFVVLSSSSDSESEKDITDAPVLQSNIFNGTLRFNNTWLPDYGDQSSVAYTLLADEALRQLDLALNNTEYKDLYTAFIYDIQEGSILVFFQMVLEVITDTVDLLSTLEEGVSNIPPAQLSPFKLIEIILTAIEMNTSPTPTVQTATSQPTDNSGISSSTSPGATTSSSTTVFVPDSSTTMFSQPDSTSTSSSTPTSTISTTPSSTSTTTTSTTTTTPSTTTTTPTTTTTTTTTTTPTSTTEGPTLWITDPVRTTPSTSFCYDVSDDRCIELGFTRTGSPNLLDETPDDTYSYLTAFFSASQSRNCSLHAKNFGCALGYPQCSGSSSILIHPCREYCTEIERDCGIPLNCNDFPDDDTRTICIPSPTSSRQDNSSYPEPTACPPGDFLCGNDRCVSRNARCDGIDHCGDYSDEAPCLQTLENLACDFDQVREGTMCEYQLDVWHGTHMWRLAQGAAPSTNTGPLYDHTHRRNTGYYMLAEASGYFWQDTTRLLSTRVNVTADRCLRFYYFMYGEDVESLKVKYHFDTTANEEVIWQRWREAGPTWEYGYVNLPHGENYYIVFEATRGGSYRGDIAIDDIEVIRGACPTYDCAENEFQCADGHCIADKFVCNSENDCQDYSDERNCECDFRTEFQCDMGMCISSHYRCDGVEQCPDFTDEDNCECPIGRVKCPIEERCIQSEWLCDREEDCTDGWDESEAVCGSCAESEFQCEDYTCVPDTARCDGFSDCTDGSDESRCVRINNDDVLQVLNAGIWKPVCFESFPEPFGARICSHVGYGELVTYRGEALSSTDGYMSWDGSEVGSIVDMLQHLQDVQNCPSTQVVHIECGASQCGVRSSSLPQANVINGQDASEGSWPWQVGLHNRLTNKVKCGGSLIDNSHVLTAAHCFEGNFEKQNYEIRLGSIYQTQDDSKRVRRNIDQIEIHPNYETFFFGEDVAIVTLSEPVTYSSYVRPICFADADTRVPLNSICYASGWGYTVHSDRTQPEILQETKMKLWSNEQCRESYSYVKDSMICAGYNNGYTVTCQGDSGGPLQCQDEAGIWRLIGVFSFLATGCAVPEKPAVFTRASYFQQWITNQLDCAFICDNGECLLNPATVCDSHNDCGDWSDELNQCETSVSCGFETDFKCGYSDVPNTGVSSWNAYSAVSNPLDDNVGPTHDNSRNNDGKFMFAGVGEAWLASPVLDLEETHCLHFHYHVRGTNPGSLQILREGVTDDITHPTQASYSSLQSLWGPRFPGAFDSWQADVVQISQGRQILVFQAREQIEGRGDYPLIALDDVSLFRGSCSQFACEADEIKCSGESVCVPASQQCNYQAMCMQLTDEQNCDSKQPYVCDFEHYSDCKLEDGFQTDTLDWRLISSNSLAENRPQTDHTLGTDAGYYGYVNARESAGQRARWSLAIDAPSNGSCFMFYYNMASNGVLRVRFYTSSDTGENVAQIEGEHDRVWKELQVELTSNINLITIDAITGSGDQDAATSYIAIDDISIIHEPCTTPVCAPGQHQCDDYTCISASLLCDGYDDCDDDTYSDENAQNCPCTEDTFQCPGYDYCLVGSVVCNGDENCLDGSDEEDCCLDGFITCSNGECVNATYVCDGFTDCLDDSDEMSCPCDNTTFICDDGSCLVGNVVCNGVDNCQNGEDELYCAPCPEDVEFTCDNGQCQPIGNWCDGERHCLDGSDEKPDCECREEQFRCDGKCILGHKYCDGISNCQDGTDEPASCTCNPTWHFQCDDGTCLSLLHVCDGEPQCSRAEDERNCTCPSHSFQCLSGMCIDEAFECDGQYDCFDLSDETQCDCDPSTHRRCANNLCLDASLFCNGVNDCLDYSDEANCGAVCAEGEFQCGNGVCVHADDVCNGHDNCGDETDEGNCPCRIGEYQCTVNGRCLQSSWVCDGTNDCSDGQDESECPTCSEGQFQCGDYTCIEMALVCDGDMQCPEGADEMHCVQLVDSTDHSGIVYVNTTGGADTLPVCNNNWQPAFSDQICHLLGKGPASFTGNVTSVSSDTYKALPSTANSFSLASLEDTSSCDNNEIVKVTCEEKQCGQVTANTGSAFIVGGDIAAEGAWPWVGGLYYHGSFRCAVVLIDTNWALSAAHCFRWSSNQADMTSLTDSFHIEFGSNQRNSATAQRVHLEAITMNPNFNRAGSDAAAFLTHDIAVIQLRSAVELSDHVHTLCLPEPSDVFNTRSICYVAGWGYTYRHRRERGDLAFDLREAKLTLMDDSDCNYIGKWPFMDEATQICAGYDNQYITTCSGDSGSPIMCRDYSTGGWSLLGIHSMGPAHCGEIQNGPPPLFVEVQPYLNWIRTVTAASKR